MGLHAPDRRERMRERFARITAQFDVEPMDITELTYDDADLRLDGVVPEEINQAFLAEVGQSDQNEATGIRQHYGRIMASSAVPLVAAGTPLSDAYPPGSALARLIALPALAGAIQSLVGPDCAFDHHFLHITFPPDYYQAMGQESVSQHTHQDSTIDPRQAFDIQLMYFPHKVTRAMGGTRFVPGSHLRLVSEAAIARYQNIAGQQHMVCEAGTVLIVHHGIWHGGGVNQSDRLRYMFKIRLCPTRRQVRLWDTSDLPAEHLQRPIFWTGGERGPLTLDDVLMAPEPWHEADTGRLEYLNRIRFWRYLTGDAHFDVDYWLTRVENDPGARPSAERQNRTPPPPAGITQP